MDFQNANGTVIAVYKSIVDHKLINEIILKGAKTVYFPKYLARHVIPTERLEEESPRHRYIWEQKTSI